VLEILKRRDKNWEEIINMETKLMSVKEAIITAMSEEMRRDENVFLMGEDVGIFGGDFGTSVGMLEEFGEERIRICLFQNQQFQEQLLERQ